LALFLYLLHERTQVLVTFQHYHVTQRLVVYNKQCWKYNTIQYKYNTMQICIAPLVASESEALGDSV